MAKLAAAVPPSETDQRQLASEQVVDSIDADSTDRSISIHKDGWFAQTKISATFVANGAFTSSRRE